MLETLQSKAEKIINIDQTIKINNMIKEYNSSKDSTYKLGLGCGIRNLLEYKTYYLVLNSEFMGKTVYPINKHAIDKYFNNLKVETKILTN